MYIYRSLIGAVIAPKNREPQTQNPLPAAGADTARASRAKAPALRMAWTSDNDLVGLWGMPLWVPFKGLGFRGLGFHGLGVYGFRVYGFRVESLGFTT